MSRTAQRSGYKRPFRRPELKTKGPDRRARGFYRMADRGEGTLAGMPLDSAEEAAVAAVRLGYKVAATQIERSGRLAQRLRDAGQRQAGPDPERQAADATERLLFDSLMTGLEWLEAAAGEPGSPLRRLVAAEYRLLGSLFGLTEPGSATSKPRREPPERDEEDDAAGRRPPRKRTAPTRIFLPRETPRAVRLVSWEIEGDLDEHELSVIFYSVNDSDATPIMAQLFLDKTPPHLHVETQPSSPPGPWRGAVCLSTGEQVGIIEMEL
jgi:hypothetical protein